MPRQVMTLEDAKQVVRDALAEHGEGIDLRPLLASIPEGKRALVARYFAELRKSGTVETTLTVDTETGEKSHVVRLPKVGE